MSNLPDWEQVPLLDIPEEEIYEEDDEDFEVEEIDDEYYPEDER